MRSAGWLFALASPVLCGTILVAQGAPYVERVEVARVLIDARVFDHRGAPITGLGPPDFVVTIGRRPARVESVQWVGQAQEAPPGDAAAVPPSNGSRQAARPEAAPVETSGRLIVFLVQKDLELLPFRVTGLMQLTRLADDLLEPLTADDRIAVLSFDSRLWLWTDFTNDLGRVRSVLRDDLLTKRPGPVEPSADVSLLSRIDAGTAARTWRIEDALRHVAEALEPLPGAKSIVLIGYGFGRLMMTGVVMMDGYQAAGAALARARVTVFTLNVTQADYNSLQAGLQSVSVETGGVYESLFHFPAQAIRRITQALTGHYVLFVEKPDLPPGAHRIAVGLASRAGRVVTARAIVPAP